MTSNYVTRPLGTPWLDCQAAKAEADKWRAVLKDLETKR